MNVATSFERRVAALIAEYAERAPMDVDPLAMARLAAATAGSVPLRFDIGWRLPRLGLTLLGLAVAIALIGTVLVTGSLPFRRDQTWTPVEGVPPFVGLPPEGAVASVPETGEVVLRFAARMPILGMEAQQSFLYADGRLIWQRNLEGSESAQAIFGDLEPTRAVIEQRLTPDGVALIRADVLASISTVERRNGRPGTLPWGGIELSIDGEPQAISWSDPSLPARLADPGSWLPPSAWADRQLRGYVPSSYAVCLDPELALADLPPAAANLLRGRVGSVGPGNPTSIGTCYVVTTQVAREIVAALDDAQFVRCGPQSTPSNPYFGFTVNPDEACTYTDITFPEILPDGELLLRGG